MQGPPRGNGRSTGVILAIAVLAGFGLVFGLVVAVTFLGSTAEPKFEQVGGPVGDPSNGDPQIIELPDTSRPSGSGLPLGEVAPGWTAAALPIDEDIAALLEVVDGAAYLEQDEPVESGPVPAYCSDEEPLAIGGHVRLWTGGSGDVEVDVRVHDMGSAGEARRAIESRQGEAFVDCIPGEITPQLLSTSPIGGTATDSSTAPTGDQPEVRVLIESETAAALLLWRQVGQYTVSIKIFDLDTDGGGALDLESADDLVAATAARLED